MPPRCGCLSSRSSRRALYERLISLIGLGPTSGDFTVCGASLRASSRAGMQPPRSTGLWRFIAVSRGFRMIRNRQPHNINPLLTRWAVSLGTCAVVPSLKNRAQSTYVPVAHDLRRSTALGTTAAAAHPRVPGARHPSGRQVTSQYGTCSKACAGNRRRNALHAVPPPMRPR